jgi:hypothetical protein
VDIVAAHTALLHMTPPSSGKQILGIAIDWS